MLPSGGSHEQPKRDAGAAKSTAGAAAGDEKVDEPASEYARLERFVVAFLVCDNALLTLAGLSKGRRRYNAVHLEVMAGHKHEFVLVICLRYTRLVGRR